MKDLADQSEIFYGAVGGGSTHGFFMNSKGNTYEKIAAFMSGIHQSEVNK